MKPKILVICVMAISWASCKKEPIVDNGVPTILKGNVRDPIRGIPISGYKVVLEKTVGLSYGGLLGMQGTTFETTGEAYTDNNGDYSISFNYKLEPGQNYHLVEQYYGIPYYHESSSGSGPFVAGATNVIDMMAWKPIELTLNVQVLNNNAPPLHIRNVIAATNKTFLNVENVYQQNITGMYLFKSRPNSDINIIFWYYVNPNSPSPVLHQKIIPYHTTLDSTTTLNFTIDCSTF